MYRPPMDGQMPPGQLPPGQLPPGQMQPPPGHPCRATASACSNLCLQLEQRLVAETQGGTQGRELLPKIENDMRTIERDYRNAQMQLNRSDCWDQFLFSRTLRRTPALRAARQRGRQRQAAAGRSRGAAPPDHGHAASGARSRTTSSASSRATTAGRSTSRRSRRRDAARNPFSSLWGEESDGPRGNANQFGNLPFATYRTLCVRLCDGYYFPVSFSTLPNHFQRDADLCQSQCAAPAELYYHQNPGGAVEQMVSVAASNPIRA